MRNVINFYLYAAIFKMEHYADLIPGFFGLQNDTLCRFGSWILRFSECYTMPIWFLDFSVFRMIHCAYLVSGFFGFQNETPCQYSYTFIITGQDAKSTSVRGSFLSVGCISLWERISIWAVAEEG